MGTVDRSMVTGKTCRLSEDDASFKAPCRDVDEARDESSGANEAQTIGEAIEAKCDV